MYYKVIFLFIIIYTKNKNVDISIVNLNINLFFNKAIIVNEEIKVITKQFLNVIEIIQLTLFNIKIVFLG